MDIQATEVLLEELAIALPPQAARARELLDRLSELDVLVQPIPSTKRLADTIRARVGIGEDVDPVALVREAREAADSVEAARAVQIALTDAVHLHELAVNNSAGQLLPVVRAQLEEIYVQVRSLPDTTPTASEEAVHADERGRKAFVALEGLSVRHGRLRQLHRQLIVDGVDDQVALVLFADTQLKPDAWPSRIQPAQAAGPTNAIARLRWLARPEAQAWVPSAAEISERYQEAQRALWAPVTKEA